MLSCLRIRNFAIVDELEIELGPGLNVVTGETGAGKSILVDALELVLGGRARPEVVRSGTGQAEIEALFTVEGAVASRLVAAGIEPAAELLLRRVVTAQGRSRAYVDGRLVTGAQLQTLAASLVDISSQHEHHALAEPASQLAYLDAFAGLGARVATMRETFERLGAVERELDAALVRERSRGEREDLLRYQLAELDELDPRPGESAELAAERERLRHAEKLLSATAAAEDALYGRDGAIAEELAQVASRLAGAAALDPTLAALSDAVRGACAQLEDAARELGAYARTVGLDPERLGVVEERLFAIARLARKHALGADALGGDTSGALAARRADLRRELAALSDAEARLGELEAERVWAHGEATKVASELSAVRSAAALELGPALEHELRGLGMTGAQVRVAVERRTGEGSRLTATGLDTVTLLVASNQGEEARPLGTIASGGELSRTMLAFKRVLSVRTGARGTGSLFVFDEVDVGVGGAIGEVIGRSLADVARHHPVLCITHLAPIAAYADRHFVVRKSVHGGRTRSHAVALSERERVDELARMLGGLSITKRTRGVAIELLRGARTAGSLALAS